MRFSFSSVDIKIGGSHLTGQAAACIIAMTVAIALNFGCGTRLKESVAAARIQSLNRKPISDNPQIRSVVDSAIEQTKHTFEYDPSYAKIDYPGGDVPLEKGVCADVIVRAFRSAGIDLQQRVHDDMSRHFSEYPAKWGARKPDTNIDHRRVPNLMTFLEREGKLVPITNKPSDYLPGDVVAWELDSHLSHIGLVSDVVAEGTPNYLIVHNIGAGAKDRRRAYVMEDNRPLSNVEVR